MGFAGAAADSAAFVGDAGASAEADGVDASVSAADAGTSADAGVIDEGVGSAGFAVSAGLTGSAEAADCAILSLVAAGPGFIVLIVGGSLRGGGCWSSAPPISRMTILLARRSSRRTLPVARITSGRLSGGITISATTNITMISTMPKINVQRKCSECPHRPAGYPTGAARIQSSMIVNAGRGVKP
jgi:hypothetical protein